MLPRLADAAPGGRKPEVLSGPGPEGWRELNVEVTPIDTEIGVYSFTCPYCQGTIIYDPRQLGPPRPR